MKTVENAQAHAKRLILVNGPMGVGKTAVCRQLVRLCAPAAFLDGDWCWMLEPFTVTPETKELVLSNIAHMLESYGRCTACRTVVFCWVMHQQEIIDEILSRLDTAHCQVINISLICTEEELVCRLQKDVEAGIRTADVIRRSVSRLPLYKELDTIPVDTSGLDASAVAGEIMASIRMWQSASELDLPSIRSLISATRSYPRPRRRTANRSP